MDPIPAGGDTVGEHEPSGVEALPRPQDREQRVEDRDVADVARLGGAFEAPLHGDEAALEAHVVPPEPGQLAGAHAGVDRGGVEHEDGLAFVTGGAQEAGDLFIGAKEPEVAVEDPDLRLPDARDLDDPAEVERDVEHRDEQGQVVMDRLRVELLLLRHEAVDVLHAEVADRERAERRAKVPPDDALVVLAAALHLRPVRDPVVAQVGERLLRRRRRAQLAVHLLDELLVLAQLEGRVALVVVELAPALPVLVVPPDAPLVAEPRGLRHGQPPLGRQAVVRPCDNPRPVRRAVVRSPWPQNWPHRVLRPPETRNPSGIIPRGFRCFRIVAGAGFEPTTFGL